MDILDIEFEAYGEKWTIKSYLIEILATLWQEGERFSPKRAIGDSGWQWEVYSALVREKKVAGNLDERGYAEDVDISASDKLIIEAIKTLGI